MTEERPERTIEVDYLARVEGEGALTMRFDGDQLKEVQLRIFEPPRFFEAFLQGRDQREAPDITGRICGICPVAYMMSAVHAIEQGHGVTLHPSLRALRRLLYCGEWIESHGLHVFMLHAPDFLGYQDAVSMAADHAPMVKAGLQIKKIGNRIVEVVGGRAVHPVNIRVGGFFRAPTKAELQAIVPDLEAARDLALEALDWLASFDFPAAAADVELVALVHPDEYPMNEGRIVSTAGIDIEATAWNEVFEELHFERSNALHGRIRGRGAYLCGPLARLALNYDRLTPLAAREARRLGIAPGERNMYRSLLVRQLETILAYEEALRIVAEYEPPPAPYVEVPDAAAIGQAATEAPRGLLYHRYEIADDGAIAVAQIVPPTSQNQGAIEADLAAIAPRLAEMPLEEATWLAEQTIRNYDPCISCATHFLTLAIERE